MKKIFLVFFLTISFVFSSEESYWIVFQGGIAATPSSAVREMDDLVKDKDIDEIRELLFSEDVALKGLSVNVLEILYEMNIIDLDSIELNQIKRLYTSKEELKLLFGCDNFYSVTLEEYLNNDHGFRNTAKERYTNLIEEYYLNE